jgi:hypothetical protein
MNERTLLAIRSLGLNGLSLDTLANTLKDMNPVPAARSGERKYGFLSLAGYELSATAYGKVTAVKLPAGYQLSATGSGRVIVDVNEG